MNKSNIFIIIIYDLKNSLNVQKITELNHYVNI